MTEALNVLGEKLEICCTSPMTGFYRDGYCQTGVSDVGSHLICAELTEDFLEFTKRRGNDLSTPRPEYLFPGLKSGDRWCLCVSRWKEALNSGVAPPVILSATHQKALEVLPLEVLQEHSLTIN
ncbi:MAG: DUF2237 domain-containing protein [Trichodesmium sp. MAG_R04]|nr:DUF2237 domain-containing protein [Trichodesmium sp. MAG_R04]